MYIRIPAENFRGVALNCLKFINIRSFYGVKVSRLPHNAGHADLDLKIQKCPCVKYETVLGKRSHVINMGFL